MTTRTPLRRDLADLKQKVYLLGEKCVEVADLFNSLLESYSNNLEKRLIDITGEVKKESKDLNDQCFLVLTLQQPLIRDLRFVIGSLQIVLSLEKTTDQYLSTLSSITEINILELSIKDQFLSMSRKVHDLLKAALTLYLSSNLDFTNELSGILSEINYLHDLLYKKVLKGVAQESGQKAQADAQLLTTIRTLEKIADSVLNIQEQVKYIIIGSKGHEESP